MANEKPKLSDLEIRKYQRTIRSGIKKKLFEDVINSPKLKERKSKSRDRIGDFEKNWSIGEKIIKLKYHGKSKSTRTRNNRRISNLIYESIFSNTGIINEYKENRRLSIEENYKHAEVETYHNRTENFFKIYGEEVDGRKKSLNEYLKDYDNGLISKSDMNRIIKRFQDYHLANYDSTIYNSKSYRQAYKKPKSKRYK